MPNHADLFPGIPEDFPIAKVLYSLSGSQPKLSVVKARDGKFYAPGATPDEVRADYENCVDLQMQMSAYCKRKIVELPGAESAILKAGFQKFVRQEFCSTPEQAKWVFDKLAAELGWAPLPPV